MHTTPRPRLPRLVMATLAAAVTTLGALGTAPAQALGSTTLAWHLTSTRTTRGAVDTLSGTVTRAGTARTVVLQRWYSSAWHSTTTRTRTTTGRFSLRVPTATAGRFTYRLYVPAAGGRAGVASRGVVLTVVAPPVSNPRAYAFLSRVGNTAAPLARWNPCSPTGTVDHHAIGYRVNPAHAPAGAAADVAGAFARLASATGLTFVNRGSTAILPGAAGQPSYPADTQVVIAWSARGVSSYLPRGSAEAATGGAMWQTGYRDASGHPAGSIVRGFVVADAATHLAAGFGAGPSTGLQGTEGQLLMHELGHVAGLAHPAISDPTEVMSPVLTHKAAAWGAGDRAGLRLVGAAAGCLHRG